MRILNILLYRVVLGINIYIIVWFYSQTLMRKYSFARTFLIYYLCDFLDTLIAADLMHEYNLKAIMYMVYNTVIIFVMFEGKNMKKLISGLQIYLAQTLCEVQGFCILTIIGFDIGMIEDYTVIKNLLIIIDMPTEAAICYGILKFQRGLHFELDRRKVFMIAKCYLCEIIVLMAMINCEGYFNRFFSTTILIGKFVIIATMLYLIMMMRSMETKQITENKTRYLQQQSKMVLQYCNAINEKTSGLEELRESYERKLQEIYAVVNQNQREIRKSDLREKRPADIENVVVFTSFSRAEDVSDSRQKQKADKSEKTRTGTDGKYHFDNVIVSQVSNGILELIAGNRELAALLNNGDLTLKLDLSAIPVHAQMEALDLSAMLYNMLENAYEAVERQLTESKNTKGKPSFYIMASAKREADRLTIRIKNSKSVHQSVTGYQDRWKTSKENKKIHGYGMGIIKSIAEKYHGAMTVDYGSDWFENAVTIKSGSN